MEKKWCVEVWGTFGDFTTELFYTEREAEQYFKMIRRTLDSSKYTFTKETITSIENPDDVIVLSNLNDL